MSALKQRTSSTCRVFVFCLSTQSFLSTEEFAQLAHQENKPRSDILAFRIPNDDNEESNIHAQVATAKFSDEVSDAPDLRVVHRFE